MIDRNTQSRWGKKNRATNRKFAIFRIFLEQSRDELGGMGGAWVNFDWCEFETISEARFVFVVLKRYELELSHHIVIVRSDWDA